MTRIQPLLKYYPTRVGKTLLSVEGNFINLISNDVPWMGLDLTNFWQAKEFIIELERANGVCITTGLGLGIIQTLLAANPKVSKIFVFEKNRDVIEIFKIIAEKNNFDISKIEIINSDARECSGVICDCMFLDHFEYESEKDILDEVRLIANQNNAIIVWYWPAAQHFLLYCEKNRLEVDNHSFSLWKNYTGIKNLPNDLLDKDILNIKNLKTVYKEHAKWSMLTKSLDIAESKNKLLDFAKRIK